VSWVLQDLEPPDPAKEILHNGIEQILQQLQDHGLGGGSELAVMPTDALVVDARRFQFRIVSHHGTLREVCSWNPDLCGVLSVWRDPANGLTYVVDGHHRHALGVRLGVPRLAVRFLSAPDARSARVVGALINISHKNATPIDAAKLLRDAGMGPQEVAAHGVALNGRLMQVALELAALPGELFEAVAMDDLPVDLGAAIGSCGGEHQIMRDLHRAAKAGRWCSAKTREAADVARFATVQVVDGCGFLPGLMEQLSSDLEQLLEIRAAVRARLRSEIVALQLAARPRAAAHLERAGSLIDREGSHAARARAQTGLELFAVLVNQRGPLSDLLNMLAGEIGPDHSAAEIVEAHLDLLRDALQAEMS
jgi:hypothetical protein